MSLASWWDDEKGVKYEEIFIRMTVFVFDRECMRWQGRQKLKESWTELIGLPDSDCEPSKSVVKISLFEVNLTMKPVPNLIM